MTTDEFPVMPRPAQPGLPGRPAARGRPSPLSLGGDAVTDGRPMSPQYGPVSDRTKRGLAMTDDVIARAEAALVSNDPDFTLAVFVPPLLAALKAERAQRYNAGELNESVITHVLADIDQVINEGQWSLRERLRAIQKICDGSEYNSGK